MNSDDFNNTVKSVAETIIANARDELSAMTDSSELEKFWFFQYNENSTPEWNTYQFQEMLALYKRKCRDWESIHNGTQCVVERVRDRYLMPKIIDFIKDLKKNCRHD